MAAVNLVRSLKPRCQIHGVPHHGVTHHELRSDAADQRFAGRDANPDIALHWDGAHTEEFGQLLTESPHALDHVHRGEASEMGLFCLLRAPQYAMIASPMYLSIIPRWLGHGLAVAYFIAHAPRGFFPLLNAGELAIIYCFVFLYLAVAGGGVWSLDHLRASNKASQAAWHTSGR